MSERIVFFGSPDFAVPTLKVLADKFNVVGVVTQPDRPAGRGRMMHPPAVKTAALELNLPLMQTFDIREEDAHQQLIDWQPDVIVVAAFGQILRNKVLNFPKFGCINVHASLLPRWRGASPINSVIYHGDLESGVTIMKMDRGVDTGDILSQRAITLSEDETASSLSEKLSLLGGELLVETLPKVLSGELNGTPQDESMATHAPMMVKKDGNLDFYRSAVELERQVRAFSQWPGTFTMWKKKPIKVHKVQVRDISGKPPGYRAIIDGEPAIYTKNGVLILAELQPSGKKRMAGKVFLNGAHDWNHN
jgi:methionyl-tRNA formyltransferase